jgi:hypothetical protein
MKSETTRGGLVFIGSNIPAVVHFLSGSKRFWFKTAADEGIINRTAVGKLNTYRQRFKS